MIPETIEQTIREFDYCQYGFCGLHDLDEMPEVRWPTELAKEIAKAIAPEGEVSQ